MRSGKLRSGFTTGAAAAAAAKAAVVILAGKPAPDRVIISFLDGSTGSIPIAKCRLDSPDKAIAGVIKDAGDDPDVTNKALIAVEVSCHRPGSGQVHIKGGAGVGRVTKPGLEVGIGKPAITKGPRTMITNEVRTALSSLGLDWDVTVQIFVPNGEDMARKTLNARLGIMGGISILGTTGIVRPMSHAAYKATIEKALDVARAVGVDHVVLATGRRSERFAQGLWPGLDETAFVQMGDFFSFALLQAYDKGFRHVVIAVFFGKAVKIAQGLAHTHANRGAVNMQALADWCLKAGASRVLAEQVACCNTARQAFEIIRRKIPEAICQVGKRMLQAAEQYFPAPGKLEVVIFDFAGQKVYHGQNKLPGTCTLC